MIRATTSNAWTSPPTGYANTPSNHNSNSTATSVHIMATLPFRRRLPVTPKPPIGCANLPGIDNVITQNSRKHGKVSSPVLFARLVTFYAGYDTVMTAFSVVLALGISEAVGIIFGIYPAWKGSYMDPIEALRDE